MERSGRQHRRKSGGGGSVSGFDLTIEQLQEISETYERRIREGLATSGLEIGALPTYLGLPDGTQTGKALVIDTGGTNMRAATVELKPRDGEIISGPVTDKVPDGRDGVALSADAFFEAQAALADRVDHTADALPLGYCFSYPAENTPDGDATLLRWTKGLRIDGVVGTKVGSALQKRLEAQGAHTSRLAVLNDTVASLLGGAHLYAEPRFGTNYIGLILGTGTNMAGIFTPEHLTKIEADYPMVCNLESGNFNCPLLTEYDDKLDAQSVNPGRQRFEKAVSGHYLPQLFALMFPEQEPLTDSGALVSLRDSGEGKPAQVAGQLLRRSARLAAAGLAAVTRLYNPQYDTAVLGEGGLLWGDPQFAPTISATLKELLPDRTIELVHQRDNVNLLGAAAAAIP